MSVTTRLRELLAQPGLLVAPGAYDALSARLIAQAGFSAVYMTGFGTAASVLGQPDVGLLTMSEMVSRAAALAAIVGDRPLIADADTGYGNPINVHRTIAVHGLEDALHRGLAYRQAGADIIFIEAPRSLRELHAIAQTFPDVPLLYNWAESGKTPLLSLEEIRALGFKLVIFPVSMLFAATYAVLGLLEVLKQGQTPTIFAERMITFSHFTEQIGLPDIQALERRYGVDQ